MELNKHIIKEFCDWHGIRVIDSNGRAYKYQKVDIKYFTDPENYNKIYEEDAIRYDTEPLYTIQIAESVLQNIAEFEKQVFNHMKETGHYDLFNKLMEQKEKEKYLRDKYPAVKNAYEQYSLMLKLASNGEL